MSIPVSRLTALHANFVAVPMAFSLKGEEDKALIDSFIKQNGKTLLQTGPFSVDLLRKNNEVFFLVTSKSKAVRLFGLTGGKLEERTGRQSDETIYALASAKDNLEKIGLYAVELRSIANNLPDETPFVSSLSGGRVVAKENFYNQDAAYAEKEGLNLTRIRSTEKQNRAPVILDEVDAVVAKRKKSLIDTINIYEKEFKITKGSEIKYLN